ncbi:MAG: asparagine synthase (glutamine-hydrolyzing) [Magnetococcales bacterium]|nr:asparagine synthase (glutamine-hydrolyzing) [Magnetococcales bacterium]
MCGIAGLLSHRPVAPGLLQAMLEPLRPRGPDVARCQTWEPDHAVRTALLHTRLSVRDLREAAHQPMSSPDGQVWICYNGEVYGWETDRAQLESQGFAFQTSGDTEFILKAYLAWDLGFLERLRGMFALAILDFRQNRLLLARDRLGIKPLVYTRNRHGVAFASVVRALVPFLPEEERRFDPEALDAYLAHRYIPGSRSVYPAIRRLPPGYLARIDLRDHQMEIRPYWQLAATRHPGNLAERVREAVQLRTPSDRPLGLFLSGGIDSATVAASLPEAVRPRMQAFTMGFPGTPFDESPTAARLAARLGFPHTILQIREELAEDFPRIVADLDEPFADPSAIPTWYLARETRKSAVVVLGGDGGDELFGGYKRYAKHLATRWQPRLPGIWPTFTPHAPPGRLAKINDALALSWEESYMLRFSGLFPAMRRFLQPDFPVNPKPYWKTPPSAPNVSPLERLSWIDFHNYLPDYILRKADLCTMAHGLELRVPLLDHKLVEEVWALPHPERFTRPAKLALRPCCPPCQEERLFTAPKRGFNPPLNTWLTGPLTPFLQDLGPRLQQVSGAQIEAGAVTALTRAFQQGHHRLAEQVFQLLLLTLSLEQLTRHGAHRLH